METDYIVSARSYVSIEKEAIDLMAGTLLLSDDIGNFDVLEFANDMLHVKYGYAITCLIGDRPDIEGYTDFNKRVVFVKESVFEYQTHRDRVTVGHELGHVVLHKNQFVNQEAVAARSNYTAPIYQKAEWQAYVFGRAILIPLPALNKIVEDNSDKSTSFLVNAISQHFNVSERIAEMRLETYGHFKKKGQLGRLLSYAKTKATSSQLVAYE